MSVRRIGLRPVHAPEARGARWQQSDRFYFNRPKTTQARMPVLLFVLMGTMASGQPLEAVRVVSRPLDRTITLPGELMPYLSVPIHAKISGFVEKVEVDRGSKVSEGQLLATLVAPELTAQHAEAE